MPIGILEFNLPEEQAEFNNACKAGEMSASLWDIQQLCRSLFKHGKPPEERLIKTLEKIREIAAEFE